MEFGSIFAKKSSEIEEAILFIKRENIKLSTIRLIYYSKLKSNTIRRKIKKKTRNLTQSCARNDPIDCRIKGFLFCDFENKVRHSRSNFFQFSPQNLDFKHSMDAEMSLEEEESERFKD